MTNHKDECIVHTLDRVFLFLLVGTNRVFSFNGSRKGNSVLSLEKSMGVELALAVNCSKLVLSA